MWPSWPQVFLLIVATAIGLAPGTRKAMKAIKNNQAVFPCDVCGLTFTKPLEWERHVNGRRHLINMEKWVPPEAMYLEYSTSAPLWASSTKAAPSKKTRDDYKQEKRNKEEHREPGQELQTLEQEQEQEQHARQRQEELTLNVSKLWSNDELSTLQFKFRATCLHPSTMMKHLQPHQKCRVWRYLRDAMGVGHYTEVATIMAAVDAFIGEADEDEDEGEGQAEGERVRVPVPMGPGTNRDRYAKQHANLGFLRIKELFESFEAYRVLSNFVLAAEKRGPVPRIVELGAGHGLVGVLLAYRFPHIEVVLIDRARRGIFDIFLECWERHGHESPLLDKYRGEAPEGKASAANKALPNIRFVEGDISQADNPETLPAGSVVVVVHGCNEVNQIAIEMALKHSCAWIAMPCCIRKDMYLGANVLIESDDVRHSIMCGALASTYGAQFMTEIDKRITNRGIVIGGGVGVGAWVWTWAWLWMWMWAWVCVWTWAWAWGWVWTWVWTWVREETRRCLLLLPRLAACP